MLSSSAAYDEIQYAIISTLHNITITSGTYFTKTLFFGIQSFRELMNMHSNLWQKQRTLVNVIRTIQVQIRVFHLFGEKRVFYMGVSQFCLTVPKILRKIISAIE